MSLFRVDTANHLQIEKPAQSCLPAINTFSLAIPFEAKFRRALQRNRFLKYNISFLDDRWQALSALVRLSYLKKDNLLSYKIRGHGLVHVCMK